MKLTFDITREDHLIARMTALAIAIHVLESAFPSPLPGVKPGLANIVIILVYMQFGWRIAAWVSLLRVLVGSLIIGTFLTPTFFLSLAGALGSLGVLLLVRPIPFGPVGLCLLAALSHISCQFIVAFLLFIPNTGLFRLLPVLLTFATFFGTISGIISARIWKMIEQTSTESNLTH